MTLGMWRHSQVQVALMQKLRRPVCVILIRWLNIYIYISDHVTTNISRGCVMRNYSVLSIRFIWYVIVPDSRPMVSRLLALRKSEGTPLSLDRRIVSMSSPPCCEDSVSRLECYYQISWTVVPSLSGRSNISPSVRSFSALLLTIKRVMFVFICGWYLCYMIICCLCYDISKYIPML